MDIVSLLQTVLFALLAIGILVSVHEYGHYIVAKKLGIKVLRFSIGFGKPIWQRTSGPDNTEYVVSRWPLGGYVKMLDSRDCEVKPAERHRAFNHQPVFNRILVLLAGPAFNFVLAILFFWIVFFVGVNGFKPLLGEIRADSAAAVAGLNYEDQIVAVNGDVVDTWGDAHMAMLDGVIARPELELRVRSKNSTRERTVTLSNLGDRKALTEPNALLSGLGIDQWYPETSASVAEVVANSPAARAGFKVGDEVMYVNGLSTPTRADTIREIRANPDKRVTFTLLRDGRQQDVEAELESNVDQGELVGRLGAAFGWSKDARAAYDDIQFTRKLDLLPALGKAVSETKKMSVTMVTMLAKMVTGRVSIKNISGPLNIARFAGLTAKQGPAHYIRFLALLSLSLGVLNLLPIPMLDGGQVVYQVAESIKGSPLSMRTEIIGQQVSIALLVLLMFFAFRNDLVSIFG